MKPPLGKFAWSRMIDAAAPLLDEAKKEKATIGRYVLVRELGRGGMGIVYEAEDPELRRRVALKTLARSSADSTARLRFLREAQAAARLSHPHIAAVYEATAEYIAMRLVDGPPLSKLPRDDVRRLVSIVRDAARAVHFAHEDGIIHRDLKPQNLLVEGDHVFVTDFGLAKNSDDVDSLSLSGQMLGTPAYMAPEQASGRVQDADPRTDVWGLGATLYDVLAGRPPFFDRDTARLLRSIVLDDPPPLRKFRADCPRDLELVVLRAVAKEPERRYPSAAEFADDLDRFLENRPVRAQPPTFGYRFRKFAARRRGLLTTGGVVVAAVLFAGIFVWTERGARRASDDALRLSERVATRIADREIFRRTGETERAAAAIDDGIAACRAFLEEHDAATARLLLGRLLRLRGDNEPALAELDRALLLDRNLSAAAIERGLILADRLTVELVHSGLGLTADAKELPEPLARMKARALADLEPSLRDGGDVRRIDLLFARGERARLLGDFGVAEQFFDDVLLLDRAHDGAVLALSRLELARGRSDEAWHLALGAVDLYRGFGPAYIARNPASAPSDAAGDVDRATGQHALAAAEKRLESGDRTIEAFLDRADARLSLANVEGALADFNAVLAMRPDDAMAHACRALVVARLAAEAAAEGRRDKAKKNWQSAIDDTTNALALAPHLAGALNNRGLLRLEWARLEREDGNVVLAASLRKSAAEDFDAAIDRAPRFALARLNRAVLARQDAEAAAAIGDDRECGRCLESARNDLDRCVEMNGGDAGFLCERARVFELTAERAARAGDREGEKAAVDAAARDFSAAIAAAPHRDRTLLARGRFLSRRGLRDLAVADLEAAVRETADPSVREIARRELELLGVDGGENAR